MSCLHAQMDARAEPRRLSRQCLFVHVNLSCHGAAARSHSRAFALLTRSADAG